MRSERDLMLDAFERLFARTAHKLSVEYSSEELSRSREDFAERMSRVLDLLEQAPFEVLPAGGVEILEEAIDRLSPAEVVGQLAAVPLIQHAQMVLQRLAHQTAQQKLIEHALEQADTTYGGN